MSFKSSYKKFAYGGLCIFMASVVMSPNTSTAADKNTDVLWLSDKAAKSESPELKTPSSSPKKNDDAEEPSIHVPSSKRSQPVISVRDKLLDAQHDVTAATNTHEENALNNIKPAAKGPQNIEKEENNDTSYSASPIPSVNTQTDAQIAFRESLKKTFKNNPSLKSERESVRLAYEKVFEAKTGWLPVINGEGTISSAYSESDQTGSVDTTTTSTSLTLAQPLYQSGRTDHSINQQSYNAQSAYYSYLDNVQQTLLSFITAYIDVVTAKSQLELNLQNIKRLEAQNEATLKEFEVGLLTKTDVSQSNARLARARSDLIRSRGLVKQRVARFTEISGHYLDLRSFAFPDSLFIELFDTALPSSLDSAESKALLSHPSRLSCHLNIKAAQANIDANESELYPEIALNGSLSREDEGNLGGGNDETAAVIGITASIPLFNAGLTRSRIRQAKVQKFSAWNDYERVERALKQNVSSTWQDYQTARAVLESSEAQLEAAKTAREGVYSERQVGARTVLDALDADQELINAQLAHLTAKRDLLVSKFSLLEATGQLTSDHLQLDPIFSDQLKEEFSKISLANLFSTNVKSMDNY